MGNTIMCRLAFMITPKAELLKNLNVEPKSSHWISRGTVVITPIRDFEESFEGWKQSWISKAKSDFVANFVKVWSEDFTTFTAQLRGTPVSEHFDRWWSITETELIELDAKWNPWLP